MVAVEPLKCRESIFMPQKSVLCVPHITLCVFVCGRYVEDDLVDFCIKHGIVVQAASPMGQYRFDRVSLSLV